MNTTNFSRIIFSEKFYLKIGSTWTFDSIYLFVISPVCFIGILLNLFSIMVINKIKVRNKNKNLYTFLTIYLINSSILCFITVFSFFTYSPRYFDFALSYSARIYRCIIYNSIATLLYFYSNILDLLILFERFTIFIEKFQRFKNWSPHLISIIALFGCILTHSPIFLWHYIKSDEEFYQSAADLTTFTYCGRTDFLNSRLGFILSTISLILRDLITLIVEIVLNLFTIAYYNKFIKKKLEISSITTTQTNTLMPVEVNLFFMTIVLSLISVLCHFCASVSSLTLVKHDLDTITIFLFLLISILSSVLKYSLNFFIFVLFDSNFRHSLVNFF